MIKVLITEIESSLGVHLSEYLLKLENVEIYGILKSDSKEEKIVSIKDQVKIYKQSKKDFSIRKILEEVKPHKIFCFKNFETEILKETKNVSPETIIQIEMIGDFPTIFENLKIIFTKTPLYTGPLVESSEDPFFSKLAEQIVLIEKGFKEPVIHLKEVEAALPVLDVRDLVKAYWLITEVGRFREVYGIYSREYTLKEILNLFLSLSQIKPEIKYTFEDEKIIFSISEEEVKNFKKRAYWRPQIPIHITFRDLLNWYRKKLPKNYS